MNLLCWNCQSLGTLSCARARQFNPRTRSLIAVLVETQLDKARLDGIWAKFKFGGLIEVSRDGKGVVWQCFWKQDCDFDLDNFSPNHIDGIINKGKEDEWRFTGFYCESNTSKHLVSWSCLRRLKAKHSIPWLCVRDFNEIARSHEKLGG